MVETSGSTVKLEKTDYEVDRAFDWTASQVDVYAALGKKVVDGITIGLNGTIFAYGQTGSGKTYTMVGPPQIDDFSTIQPNDQGIIPRCIDDIFSFLKAKTDQLTKDKFQSEVHICYVQLYQEEWYDLLDDDVKLQFRTSTRLNAKRFRVTSTAEALELLSEGWSARKTAETKMNRVSSRSHCVFVIEDSLGGKARTSIVVTVHSGKSYLTNIISSLQFARDCRTIESHLQVNMKITGNTVMVLNNKVNNLNQQLKDAQLEYETMLQNLREENQKLKQMILKQSPEIDEEKCIVAYDGIRKAALKDQAKAQMQAESLTKQLEEMRRMTSRLERNDLEITKQNANLIKEKQLIESQLMAVHSAHRKTMELLDDQIEATSQLCEKKEQLENQINELRVAHERTAAAFDKEKQLNKDQMKALREEHRKETQKLQSVHQQELGSLRERRFKPTEIQHEDPIQARVNSFADAMASKGLFKSCVTGLGQKYALYGTRSVDYGYELWMVTANTRNSEVLSQPMKLTTKSKDQVYILSLIDACKQHFASCPLPSLSHPPPFCVIPVNSELISFSLIDLFNDTARLLPGDEVFVTNYLTDGRIWYHSGIHIGGGFFCHFVPTNGFNLTDLNSGKTVPGVVKCVSTLGFYEAVPSEIRQAFRVTHPILVREGLTIVDQAKRFIEGEVFNDYNYVNRNCQHFSSRCSYDREFSYNTEKLFSSNEYVSSQKVGTVTPIVHPSSVGTESCRRNVVGVAKVEPIVHSNSVATESCFDSSVKENQDETNLGNYVDESQYIGGPMTQFEHKNRPSNIVSSATYEIPDSEYFFCECNKPSNFVSSCPKKALYSKHFSLCANL
ncbi:unnamed protein product, partial [Mesorhabditis belari]|uniref:Kinesin motor domain-containing protein n=1 Tax=Mesorhabditis belari TaxID=2138241 RepID=A0AAF3FAY5_9BILA